MRSPLMHREHRAACLLVAVAVAIYGIGLGWGLPSGTGPERIAPWGHDDVMPLGPLSEARELLGDGNLDRFLGYPLMQYGLVLAAYSPYLGWLALSGGLENPVGHYPYGLANPGSAFPILTLLARVLTLAMAGGTVAAGYALGLWLFGRRAGLLSAVWVMGLYPMFYYSRTGNLDVPYMCWAGWGLAVYARILRRGFSVRRAVGLGIFAALAAGTKDQAAAVFLLMPCLLVPLHLRRTRELPPARRLGWRVSPFIVTGVAGAVAYVFSSGFIVSPARWLAHVAYILGIGPHSLTFPNHPATLEGYSALLAETAFWIRAATGTPMLLAAGVGLGIAAWRDRLALGLWLPALSVGVCFIVPTRFVEGRYVLPIAFLVACAAAHPIALALESRSLGLRAAGGAWAVAILLLSFSRGAELTYAMVRDTRYAAAAWLEARAPEGSRIGFFGADQKLPRVPETLAYQRLDHFIGTRPGTRYAPAEIEAMARRVSDMAPPFILVIPDHTSLPELPRGTTLPDALYQRLADGSLGYRKLRVFEPQRLVGFLERPPIVGYPLVSPPVEVFGRVEREPPVVPDPRGEPPPTRSDYSGASARSVARIWGGDPWTYTRSAESKS